MRQRCWRISSGRCRRRGRGGAGAIAVRRGGAAAAAPPGRHRHRVAGRRHRPDRPSLLVFTAGRYGRGVAAVGTIWTVKVLAWMTLIVRVVTLATMVLSAAVRRPRPFRRARRGELGRLGDAVAAGRRPVGDPGRHAVQPGAQGPWRQAGKWVATGLVALLALAPMALGVDAPSDVLVGAVIGVTIPLLAFRWFAPGEVFPVSYHRGRSAHLDVGGARGQAIRRQQLASEAGFALGFTTRQELPQALSQRSNGRLTLDAAGR